jgi:hypothetical protein
MTGPTREMTTDIDGLERGLSPFAKKSVGSVRIDVDEVRTVLAIITRLRASEAATAAAAERAGWQDISTAPRDGSEVLILAQGMAIQARFCLGSWGPDIPGELQEYDGAVWVAFDDLTQFEVEEGSLEGGKDHHGCVTHWMPLPSTPPVAEEA